MKYVVALTGAFLALSLVSLPTAADANGYKRTSANPCYKCPKPRPHYDSTEVIKNVKEVDQSRVIETQTVVPSRRVIEHNHLVIHENETRNVGVVQHNHTIIEKETVLTKRNVDTKRVNRVVDLVEHKYNTERKRIVEEQELPGVHRDITCPCPPKQGRPLGVHAYGQAPRYVNARHTGARR